MIAPVNAMPATPHDTFWQLALCASYTFLYNILDYAVGVVPVTTVKAEIDGKAPSIASRGTDEKKSRMLRWLSYRHYNAELMAGMPVGVQVIC